MADLLRAAILGVIEGLTEFLPISSTGHIIIAMPLLGIDKNREPWSVFLYFIQIGAILAVVLHFLRPLVRSLTAPPPGGIRNHLLTKLVVGMLPATMVGLALDDFAEARLERPLPVAVALVGGAALMIWIERRFRRVHGPTIDELTWRHALLVGLAQCVSIIPGTSRAMATIMGGMVIGLPTPTAVQFSFYLAIPTLLGAGCVRLVKHREALAGEHLGLIGVGFVVAFVVAWAVVAGFMRYVQFRRLEPFAFYRVALGAVVLALGLFGVI